MKTRSAKAKGRRAAAKAKDLICGALDLSEGDIVITSSGENGEDLKLSPYARTLFPYTVEVKNQERLNIWKALEQADSHGNSPILIFTRNRDKIYCALGFEEFLQLMKRKI